MCTFARCTAARRIASAVFATPQFFLPSPDESDASTEISRSARPLRPCGLRSARCVTIWSCTLASASANSASRARRLSRATASARSPSSSAFARAASAARSRSELEGDAFGEIPEGGAFSSFVEERGGRGPRIEVYARAVGSLGSLGPAPPPLGSAPPRRARRAARAARSAEDAPPDAGASLPDGRAVSSPPPSPPRGADVDGKSPAHDIVAWSVQPRAPTRA